jgi:hypothetical protein
MTNFFNFYVTEDANPDPLNFIPIWAVDNAFFFIVLILSLKVHDRFKFVRSLLAACLLFHIESWYSLIVMFTPAIQDWMKHNFEYMVMSIHTLFLLILITPSFRPNEHEHPLPIENNLSHHNTALLDK